MDRNLFGLITGAVLLMSMGMAHAKGPVAMTDAQLDTVTAGGVAGATVLWENASGTASVSGSATTTSAIVTIVATVTPAGTGTPSLSQLSAFTVLP